MSHKQKNFHFQHNRRNRGIRTSSSSSSEFIPEEIKILKQNARAKGKDIEPIDSNRIVNQEFRNKSFGTKLDANRHPLIRAQDTKQPTIQEIKPTFSITSNAMVNHKSDAKPEVKFQVKPPVKSEANITPKSETKSESEVEVKLKTKLENNCENKLKVKPEVKPKKVCLGKWPTSLKHPLLNEWQLWFFKPPVEKNAKWEDGLSRVITFNTVEDFWALYDNIKQPSALASGCDYSLFKDDINPTWEDSRNKQGGRWLISFDKGDKARFQSPGAVVNHVWLEMLMCLIGEAFGDDGQHVCGIVVNVRGKMDKIAVWTKDKNADIVNKRIGNVLMKRSKASELKYESHQDNERKKGSMARPLYTLKPN